MSPSMTEDQKLIERARVTAYRLAGFDGPEPMSADTVSEMLAALADRLEASLKDRVGWKTVPIQWTDTMVSAGMVAATAVLISPSEMAEWREEAKASYAAMLPPAPEGK